VDPVEELYERMLGNRIVILGMPIDDYSAQLVVTHLVYLQTTDRRAPVKLMINSPGGMVGAGLTILDTMTSLEPPVFTHCLGRADSLAAILMSHGARGHRTAAPHARFSLGPVWSSKSDDETLAEIEHYEQILSEILSRNTGRPIERIKKDRMSSPSMTAPQALAYGLIDSITDKLPA
jgi:ATP-dependent Clp protease protease subunit